MSMSRVESEGQNLSALGRWWVSLFVPPMPASAPSLDVNALQASPASWACSLSLISFVLPRRDSCGSCLLILWTPTCDLLPFNLCNSVFECSLELGSAFWASSAPVLGLLCDSSKNGPLPSLSSAAVTAYTVYVCGSKMKAPAPPYT